MNEAEREMNDCLTSLEMWSKTAASDISRLLKVLEKAAADREYLVAAAHDGTLAAACADVRTYIDKIEPRAIECSAMHRALRAFRK